MKFEDVVAGIPTLTDLRRIAGAHVVDHSQLADDELRAAILKVKPQYLHRETVNANLDRALYREARTDYRVLARQILVDVLLDQYDFALPFAQTEERVIGFEQSIVNRSNETDLVDLAWGSTDSQRYKDIQLYNFVLVVAWDHEDTKSPDEVNLLRKLRTRLKINENDHRLLEAKLGKYPKPSNELHTRGEINHVRRYLQGLGLLFTVRQENRVNVDVIPVELAVVIRSVLGLELRSDSYEELLNYRLMRRKSHLADVLGRMGMEVGRYETMDVLSKRVRQYVPPSESIASNSPRYGLNSDQLASWCRELGLSASGTIEDRVAKIISHFDQLRPRVEDGADERARWYEFYEELAARDYEMLRAQHVIEKDLEIEAKFEEATQYLFAEKLNHTPLHQSGTNHPDGLLSLQSMYLMWDNKSKEEPVILREHIAQFDSYMNKADKAVPVFLVVAPAFTQESETEAIRYHAKHYDRNIVLITAKELMSLADEWSSERNKKREEPFPLGLLAATGRYNRVRLGELT
ncbi:MAG: hypothetical protein IH851_08060 [Armatimonadetes bacterium]|nr:hypothetical protein [Armatimonadota bacterium]